MKKTVLSAALVLTSTLANAGEQELYRAIAPEDLDQLDRAADYVACLKDTLVYYSTKLPSPLNWSDLVPAEYQNFVFPYETQDVLRILNAMQELERWLDYDAFQNRQQHSAEALALLQADGVYGHPPRGWADLITYAKLECGGDNPPRLPELLERG